MTSLQFTVVKEKMLEHINALSLKTTNKPQKMVVNCFNNSLWINYHGINLRCLVFDVQNHFDGFLQFFDKCLQHGIDIINDDINVINEILDDNDIENPDYIHYVAKEYVEFKYSNDTIWLQLFDK